MSPEGEGRIHLLDPDTVNQIAAGEVVERPASVVKELVENSVDAGATRVFIEVRSDRGGIETIRVVDNGCGMSPGDARLAFSPHATSKIRTIEDLGVTRTMGFRGEALASIASVSEVALTTSGHDAAGAGTEILIRAGRIVRSGEAGAPPGTTITVRDLFFNTPARKKFQKSVSSELAFLTRQIEGFAIAHPDIAFHFTHNGNDRVVTEGNGDLFDVLVSLYGNGISSELVPVEMAEGPVTISGYITKPSYSRKNPYGILVSINRRQVLAKPVSDAVREGYGTLLPDGMYPLAFIGLALDPSYIDVNVHPAKRVVRLSRERDVCSLVTRAVVKALRGADLVANAVPGEAFLPAGSAAGTMRYGPAGVREPVHDEYLLTDRRLRQTELFPECQERAEPLPEIEFLGQYDGTYILGRGAGGDLVLVDQHAAHERILYDQLKKIREESDASQELIVPVILTVSPSEFQFIGEAVPLLSERGFVIEEFGRDSYAVRAVPAVLGTITGSTVVREIILGFSGSRRAAGPDTAEMLTRSIACHGAVKAGTVMTPDQCRRLLNQLLHTSSPWTCPHGRPVIVSLCRDTLDKMFYRK